MDNFLINNLIFAKQLAKYVIDEIIGEVHGKIPNLLIQWFKLILFQIYSNNLKIFIQTFLKHSNEITVILSLLNIITLSSFKGGSLVGFSGWKLSFCAVFDFGLISTFKRPWLLFWLITLLLFRLCCNFVGLVVSNCSTVECFRWFWFTIVYKVCKINYQV